MLIRHKKGSLRRRKRISKKGLRKRDRMIEEGEGTWRGYADAEGHDQERI